MAETIRGHCVDARSHGWIAWIDHVVRSHRSLAWITSNARRAERSCSRFRREYARARRAMRRGMLRQRHARGQSQRRKRRRARMDRTRARPPCRHDSARPLDGRDRSRAPKEARRLTDYFLLRRSARCVAAATRRRGSPARDRRDASDRALRSRPCAAIEAAEVRTGRSNLCSPQDFSYGVRVAFRLTPE